MNNLADKIIEANKEEVREESKPELDDIGFPLPKPKTKKARCEYLTARILYLNQHMYKHQNKLWLNDLEIRENRESYYRLAKYPEQISIAESVYVWRRLKEIVPKLDTDWIAVLPNLLFNMKTGEFKRDDDAQTTTPWEEDE